jgi:DNA-binding response OmpR family regulator
MSAQLHGAIPQPDQSCLVLAVNLNNEDAVSLAQLSGGSNWMLRKTRTCREAVALCRKNQAAVVLCVPEMPDGDWRSLLGRLRELPQPPAVIVASRLAEEHLWAEVLNLGGYDVLHLPFDRSELLRVLFFAWRTFSRQSEGGSSATVKSAASERPATPTLIRSQSQAVA